MSLILSGTDGLSDVDGTAATPALRGTDANTGIFFGTDIIGFSEGGVEAMRIDSSGQLGIATNSPRVRLDVRSDAVIAAPTPLANAVASGVVAIGDTVGSVIGLQLNGSSYDTYFQSRNMGAGSTAYNLLLQPLGGNVGIGISPSSKLHVNGGMFVTGDLTAPTGAGVSLAYDGTVNKLETWSSTPLAIRTAGVERARIDSSGNVLVTSAAGLGYGTGSGGTVTQATSKSTNVTLNKPTGKITMNNAALGAGGSVSFQFANSLIGINDTLSVSVCWDGTVDPSNYTITAGIYQPAAGTALLILTNRSAGSLSHAVQINFAVIKGATS